MRHKVWLWVVLLMCCSMLAAQADTSETIFESHQSLSPKEEEWKFNVSPFSVEHQVRLSLDARVDWPNLAGSNPWLRVAVNGNFLTRENLLNKRNDFKVQSGIDLTWVQGDRWRILYSPDFEAAIKNTNDPMSAPKDDPYHFVWDITRLVKPGTNVLQLYNLKLIPEPTTMIFRNARIEVGTAIPPPASEDVIPAPTGPLTRYIASGRKTLPLKLSLAPDGGLTLGLSGKQIAISTRTSLPNGKWQGTADNDANASVKGTKSLVKGQMALVKWTTGLYNVQRQVKVFDDHVHIADTLTNPGKDLIGVIVEHHLKYPTTPASLRVAGRNVQPGVPSALNIAEHPSVYAQWPDLGLGMIAEDDVFRVHIKSFGDSDGMGLADNRLGIPAGTSVTLEWNLYPVTPDANSQGDYWDFVNAVRRDWGSNYTVPGPFAFLPRFPDSKPAEWYKDWVRSRGLKILCGGIAKYADGKYAHGTGIMFAPEFVAHEKEWIQKLHSVAPDVKSLAYFHAQASTEPGGETKYADSRLIGENGEHLGYPYEYRIPLYLPTRENSYGKALWGYVHTCLDDMKVDGLYWDEMSHSVLEYVTQGPWDNHTVAIDPETHAVLGKRSNVQLLMQPLQLDIAHYLREHGKYLMANTQPVTRTMLREKIVRFVETQSYQSLTDTNFGCPLGLGNHDPEVTQTDTTRHIREMLRYGGLYYADTMNLEKPPAWPFVSVMFPITPVELHEGMVLGAERIQTARSGRFGWPDGARADVYVIDADGNRVANPPVQEIVEKGHYLYDIRMPSNQFAVLVKKSAP